VVRSLTEQMKKLPYQICKSLTWDRGQELSTHKQFTIATDMEVYFCDPRSNLSLEAKVAELGEVSQSLRIDKAKLEQKILMTTQNQQSP
jgi:hypothetical protein